MPASNLQTFRAFAYNNAWANHRLLAACRKLPQEGFAMGRTSFFPSLQATLNHNLTIDWFYVDALEGGRSGPRPGRSKSPARPSSHCRPRRPLSTGA